MTENVWRTETVQGGSPPSKSHWSMEQIACQPTAQLYLGWMYENGYGVPQDYVTAHVWYNLAGIQGDEKVREYRDRIAEKMTPAQIAEAQRRAREWKPKKAK